MFQVCETSNVKSGKVWPVRKQLKKFTVFMVGIIMSPISPNTNLDLFHINILFINSYVKNVQIVPNELSNQKIVILTHFANSSVLSSPLLSVSHSKMIFFTSSGSLNFVFLWWEGGGLWPGGVCWASTVPKLKQHVIQTIAKNGMFMFPAWKLMWHCPCCWSQFFFSFVSY